MCGRYTLDQPEDLAERFNASGRLTVSRRYNIAPTQFSPVVYEDERHKRHLAMMHWGYLPSWAHDPRDVFKYKTFNSRSEGIFGKRTWKDAILHHRCLVPATGFYEWKTMRDGKQPYFIHPKDQHLYAFAGLYGSFKAEDGTEHGTFSIITTRPNNQMTSIHDRMPVIVHKEDEAAWLDPENTEKGFIEALMKPYGDDTLELFPVSRAVNAARSDEASYIQPLDSQ